MLVEHIVVADHITTIFCSGVPVRGGKPRELSVQALIERI
jgi:hypothetical protein